ncbi:SDR family NAD(P)-dependent oxidoreductase [Paracoccus sp. S-4012]|uniref:complex I NDUFA9 subunit family protein n=1 Tax=Paracoccus sp. S-4012 TaxID=2665648 RepID=UPI0012B11CE0|nr:complex I NDUFA9 subunit family protein [Paracoccus sp. S-4012]MRX50962.1 SDR family NAD(P)-dependent oxidoreductase [Paracoccus sp. S-4012]
MAKLVTIYGGSGFLGRQIARKMAQRGWRVRVAVRRPNEALFVRTYGAVGQVEPVPCNVRDDLSVRAAMTGADAVVNCVGLLVNEGRNTFAAVHDVAAARIARLSAEMGAAQLVHVSALGADAEAKSRYLASKGRGEAAILESRPDAVILRPSVMFGPGDSFYNKFAAMARPGPLMFISGGKAVLQPVFVEDVAEAAAMAAEGAVAPGIYELGGPEVTTLRGVVRDILRVTGRRRGVVNLPGWLGSAGAAVFDLVQVLTAGLLTNRIVTQDQLRSLKVPNRVAEGARGFEAFGIEPVAADVIIPTYLWRFRPSGQYAAIQRSAQKLRPRG